MHDTLSKARDISSLLYNSLLKTYYPTISTPSQINFTKSKNTGRMPVIITLVARKVPGMDFPIDHGTYPNDCKNVACTKLGGRYRPGSWVIITNKWDDGEEEFFEMESYICIECSERNKKSFNGSRILRKKEVEPVLKEKEPTRIIMAIAKPLTWVRKPTKKEEEKKLIVILAPKKLPPKNDRNAANPRPGSPAQIRMAKDKELPPTPKTSDKKKLMICIPRSPGILPREQYR